MKKTSSLVALIIAATIGFASCGGSNSGQISIKGSDTVLPFSQKIAEEFMKEHEGAVVTVTGGGSGVGISALMENTTDLAQSSRRIKFDERERLANNDRIAKEVIAGYDALAVIVHPDNKISQLTREQLEGIFTGAITNWSELGGDDIRIIPYARETSSGTYEFFRESALRNRNYMNGIMSMPASGSLIQSVSQTRGAISYVGLAHVKPSVKVLAVSYNEGENFAMPNLENVRNESYPIVRPLYFYYVESNEEKVKPLVDYMFSDAGQQILIEIGFIPLK